MACNFNCRIENDGLLKVEGSPVHSKSSNIRNVRVIKIQTLYFYRPLMGSARLFR